MVVADNKVYAQRAGIFDLFGCFDSAIEDDKKFDTLTGGHVDGGFRDAISVFVARRDIVVDMGVEVTEILVDEGHCCGSVYIIVTVDHNLLLSPHSTVEPVDGLVHVGHEKRVMQILQRGVEKFLRLSDRGNAPLHKQLANGRHSGIAFGQVGLHLLFVGCKGTVIPFTCHLCCFFFISKEGGEGRCAIIARDKALRPY